MVNSSYYNIALLLIEFPLFDRLSSQDIAPSEWYCASQILELLKSDTETNVIFNADLYKCRNLMDAKAYLVQNEIREDEGIQIENGFDD